MGQQVIKNSELNLVKGRRSESKF